MKKRPRTLLDRDTVRYLGMVLFVFGAALMKEMNLLVLLGGMLLGGLVVNWRAGLAALRRLEVRRRLPHAVDAGEALAVSLELSNGRRFSGVWAIRVEDQVRREGAAEAELRPEAWFPYVGPRQTNSQVLRGRVPRRGRYRFGPLTLSTRFPFGLLQCRRTLAGEETLLVYPRLGRLTRAWNAWRQEIAEGTRQRHRQQGRASGEFFGVREWHPGDPRRWIHWRSSAKHGTLVVRQFEQTRSHGFAILLDLWQPESPSAAELENVELAVSLAATLVTAVCRQETNQVLVAIAGVATESVQGAVSAALREEVLERLALAEATAENHLTAMLGPALDRIEVGSQVVLISTRTPALAEDEAAPWCRDPHRRLVWRQLRQISTASPRLADYFSVE